jgi:hypothetical protein
VAEAVEALGQDVDEDAAPAVQGLGRDYARHCRRPRERPDLGTLAALLMKRKCAVPAPVGGDYPCAMAACPG